EEIKNKMVEHHQKFGADGGCPENDQKTFKEWLTAFVEEKEISTPAVKEYIKQFSIGEIKKADIKINDVIRTIQDLKFKTAVEGQRDKRKSKLTGIEQQELGRSRSPLASILGFFPWIILSLAPLASLAIDF